MADGQAQYVALPDGRYVEIPVGSSPDQLAQLRTKLAHASTDITNPDVMLAKSREQAASKFDPQSNLITGGTESQGQELLARISGQARAPRTPQEATQQLKDTLKSYGGEEATLYGSGFFPSWKTAVRTGIGMAAGSGLGRWGGGALGEIFGPRARQAGEEIGATVGGIAGGIGGYRGMRLPERYGFFNEFLNPNAEFEAAARPVKGISQPMSEWPTREQHMGSRMAQRRAARGLGVPGSIAQEGGYQPSPLRVPIRPEPPYPLTPEQVPGPDTAGKGNLLTPIAKRGDPRGAQELMRRGRQVIYVPAEEYPGTKLLGTISERIGPAGGEGSAASRGPLGEGTSAVHLVEGQAPRTNLSQEMMSRAHDEARLRSVLNDPRATTEEKDDARRVLGFAH